jgi:hypothetical protein
MQEHFNALYGVKNTLKATFKGLIEKFDLKNIAPNATEYYIEGKITMHGKSKYRVPCQN